MSTSPRRFVQRRRHSAATAELLTGNALAPTANAMACATAAPMRTPVNEPGPAEKAMTHNARRSMSAASEQPVDHREQIAVVQARGEARILEPMPVRDQRHGAGSGRGLDRQHVVRFARHEPMLNVDAALRKLADLIEPVGETEQVPIAEAIGRIAAEAVRAPVDLPPFDASAMDGYAIRAGGLDHGRERSFRVIDESLAGKPARRALSSPGEAIRIFTGAVVPDGAEAVLLQEDATRCGARLTTTEPIRSGQHVRRRGHDVARGQALCRPGARLSHFHLAWFAACGIGNVTVARRIRVGVFSTGDELADPGAPLVHGQIYDSNRFALLSLLREKPVEAFDLGRLPDDRTTVANALQDAAPDLDVLVTSGGVSVGDADFVKDVVSEIGNVGFWKLALKPGKPLAVGNVGAALFFGLPGNPVSTIVTYLLFVAPAIDGLGGREPAPPITLPAIFEGRVRHTAGRREYLRGTMVARDDKLTVQCDRRPGVEPPRHLRRCELPDRGRRGARRRGNWRAGSGHPAAGRSRSPDARSDARVVSYRLGEHPLRATFEHRSPSRSLG